MVEQRKLDDRLWSDALRIPLGGYLSKKEWRGGFLLGAGVERPLTATTAAQAIFVGNYREVEFKPDELVTIQTVPKPEAVDEMCGWPMRVRAKGKDCEWLRDNKELDGDVHSYSEPGPTNFLAIYPNARVGTTSDDYIGYAETEVRLSRVFTQFDAQRVLAVSYFGHPLFGGSLVRALEQSPVLCDESSPLGDPNHIDVPEKVCKALYKRARGMDYVDNYRCARVGDINGMIAYEVARENGCCGSDDFLVKDKQGRYWMCGFNYGR